MPQPPNLSPFLRTYYKWKSIRFPWRRQFLVGFDLKNNTYWEFHDRGVPSPSSNPSSPSNPNFRWRRIVYPPPRSKLHPSEIQISPAWHQWLRHTRSTPPTLSEQAADVARQERIKVLAAQADARWAAKPGYVDAPAPATAPAPAPAFAAPAGESVRKPPMVGGGMVVEAREQEREREQEQEQEQKQEEVKKDEGQVLKDQRQKAWREMKDQEGKIPAKNDPWKQANRGGPSEEWQPKAWTPGGKR
ncbi:NADH-ubiquinone oxidoreductase assembly factor N7BML [Cladorrhinum sp. PSN332]|nr:NADH-ubiquinone oxidoreductase assembly factor N7BML [Cladorrhinum sp. PSN332]